MKASEIFHQGNNPGKVLGKKSQRAREVLEFGRGKQTFTKKYGINRWNMNTLEKDRTRDIFQAAWLGYLVKDFGISAEWLLTEKGGIFNK